MRPLKKFLEHKAYLMRVNSLIMTTMAGSGHPTSALSSADLVAALFFYAMQYDPKNPDNPNNDRFILSKGHAAPILYAAWKEVGILSDKELHAYRSFDSALEGHPTPRFMWTEAATGSLGMGLSVGNGMALSARLAQRDYYTYVLMGDSELTEGSIWEACEIAAFYKLTNLIGLVDCNRLGQSTQTIHGHHAQRYAAKFEAFGWRALIIDGHDMQQIMGALDKAREPDSHGRPTVIIAKTVKGYGIASVEDKEGFHGKAFSKEELTPILQGLEERFSSAARFDEKCFAWQPVVPSLDADLPDASTGSGRSAGEAPFIQPSHKEHKEPDPSTSFRVIGNVKPNELIATRKAYGQALTAAGVASPRIVSLDAEVKNSTYAELFEEKFPKRFFQCFVAEQNMVSMGVGFEKRGYIPFISTFGAFFTRAHDQIRMAAIGRSALRLVGSHAGISIGQDGPSQMALEDIALMRALPDSLVLYPSDAVSTYKLVEHMIQYTQGISYLRTTRMETPVLYEHSEQFPLGGCKIVRSSEQDQVTIVAAGITLFEAIKAYDQLQQEGISVSVIDLYSIKPLDEKTLLKVSEKHKKVITVEDHYLEGGLGQAVAYALRNTYTKITCMAVTHLPRSGKPQELLAWAGIDAAAIIKNVKALL